MKRKKPMRRAAVANVNCPGCGTVKAGVVMTAWFQELGKLGLIELCLDCLGEMFDVAKLLQMRLRHLEGSPRSADYGPDWTETSKAMMARDDHSCQDFDHRAIEGANLGISLVVHHMRPLRDFGGDYLAANHPSNLITLCTICHGRWHSALYQRAKRKQQGL